MHTTSSSSSLTSSLLVLLLVLCSCVAAQCPHQAAGLERWSSGATWGGTVPGAGAIVTIAAGKRVLFDVGTSADFAQVLVKGELVFDSVAGAGVHLRSRAIIVESTGTLRIGSECCPYATKATITLLHPTSVSENIQGMGTKVLAVAPGGTLEIYGDVRTPTWTQVSQTSAAGATTLTLQEPVNWAVGDSVAVAPSNFRWDEDEQHTIAAVSADRRTITLAAPLQKQVYGKQHVSGFREFAEVGLLSRNIVIQEQAGAAATFGAHVMGVGNFASFKVRGVEIVGGGQAGQLGRYPLHTHLAGDVAGRAYFYDNAIHHSHQRCITIHGTHGLRVRRNVCYNIPGHAIFVEDGIETRNVIEYNLVMHVARLNGMHPHDTQATGLWLTHPNNIVNHNHFVGVNSHCAWIALPEHPIGVSQDNSVFNRHEPLGEFNHNLVHSCTNDGLHIDTGPKPDQTLETTNYYPQEYDANGNLVKTIHNTIYDFTAWKVADGGVWCRCGIDFEGFRVAGAARGLTFASGPNGDRTKGWYRPTVTGAIMVGVTENSPDTCARSWECDFPVRGLEVYDGPMLGHNIHFWNYQDTPVRKAGAISELFEDQFSLDRMNSADKVMFHSSKNVFLPTPVNDGSKGLWITDVDGSISGRPAVGFRRVAIVPGHPIHATPGCEQPAGWGANVCPSHFHHMRIQFMEVPAEYDPAGNVVSVRRDDKPNDELVLCGLRESCPQAGKKPDQFKFPAIIGQGYNVIFRTSPPKQLQLVAGYSSLYFDVANKRHIGQTFMRFCYPPGTTVTKIRFNWGQEKAHPAAASVNNMRTRPLALNAAGTTFDYQTGGEGMYYLDCNAQRCWVHFRVVAREIRTATGKDAFFYDPQGVFQIWLQPGSNSRNWGTCTPPNDPAIAEYFAIPPKGPAIPLPAMPTPKPVVPRDDAVCGALATTASSSTTTTTTTTTTTAAVTTRTPTNVPTTAAPTTGVPTTEAPTTLAPTNAAQAGQPTTLAPTSLAPTSLAPTSRAPSTSAPTSAPAVPTGTDHKCDPAAYENNLSFLKAAYLLYWTVDEAAGEIDVCVEVQVPCGWIGFGISSGAGMANADIIIGRMLNGAWVVEDRFSLNTDVPKLDTEQGGVDSLISRGGGRLGSTSALKFRRKLVASEATDTAFAPSGDTELLLAFQTYQTAQTPPQPTDNLAYHGGSADYHETVRVNFGGANVAVPGPVSDGFTGPCEKHLAPAHSTVAKRVHLVVEWPAAQFDQFQCGAFISQLFNYLGCSPFRLQVLEARAGSVELDINLHDDATGAQVTPSGEPTAQQMVDTLRALVTGADGSDPALAHRITAIEADGTRSLAGTGSSSDSNLPLYLGIVVGALLLVILLVLLVAFLLKRRKSKQEYPYSAQPMYSALDAGTTSTYSAPAAPTPVRQQQAPPSSVRFIATSAFKGSPADSTLGASAGQTLMVELSDWRQAQGADWVWATIPSGSSGYAPVRLLRRA